MERLNNKKKHFVFLTNLAKITQMTTPKQGLRR